MGGLMLYKYAKDLHNGDEVIIKHTNEIVTVIGITYKDDKKIIIMCDDGNEYHHKDIK